MADLQLPRSDFGIETPNCVQIAPDGDALVYLGNQARTFKVQSMVFGMASDSFKGIVDDAIANKPRYPDHEHRMIGIMLPNVDSLAMEKLLQILHLKDDIGIPTTETLLKLTQISLRWYCVKKTPIRSLMIDWAVELRDDAVDPHDIWLLVLCAWFLNCSFLFEHTTRLLIHSFGGQSFVTLPYMDGVHRELVHRLRLALTEQRVLMQMELPRKIPGLCLDCLLEGDGTISHRPGCQYAARIVRDIDYPAL